MNPGINVTGQTLLHFLWQGALIGGITSITLRVLRDRSAHVRYSTACCGLAAMLAAPLVTARILSTETAVPLAWESVARSSSESAPAPVSPASGSDATVVPQTGGIDPVSMLPVVVAIWSGGVALLLLQLGCGYWRVRRLHAAAWLEGPSRWEQTALRVADRLGLARAIRIVDSSTVDTPTVVGWLQPVVLLPIAALTNLTPAQVEAILAHELAHIRRHDFIVNVVQTIAETLLFYHPAVWWLSRRIRTEREHCCDDIAVDVCGDPYSYAAALTEIASVSVAGTPFALAAGGGSLLNRVRRLLGVNRDSRRGLSGGVVALALALGLVVVGGTVRLYVLAQTPVETDHRAFGPRDLNRLLGFELLPGPERFPTDDPLDVRAWSTQVEYGDASLAMVGFTARSLIREAYDLTEIPIEGAPSWMDDETFDIKIPAGVPILVDGVTDLDAVNDAVRGYLENILNLHWHFEPREFPVYALVRAGDRLGPNIRPASWCTFLCGIDNDLRGIRAKRVTMAEFAGDFRRSLGPLSLGREVVDRTGLTGAFDFELRVGLLPLAAIGHRSAAAAALLYPFGVRSIHTALTTQLGLKLEQSTTTRQVLVIDHIDKPN